MDSSIDLGSHGLEAVALANAVALVSVDGRIAFSDGVCVETGTGISSACADADQLGIILGCEDGRLLRISSNGSIATLAQPARGWIDHVAASPASRILLAASGKTLHLLKADGTIITSKSHNSSLTGVALDAKGKRCAVSHYGGVTLHWTSGQGSPQRLEWKGSHTGVALAPEGGFVITAMQENALHGWTLPAGKHMRMDGYPAKTRSMAWTWRARTLATSGAPSLICWPFSSKEGPMGKPPLELAGHGPLITRVAAHPHSSIVAAGFEDGAVTFFNLDSLEDLPFDPAGKAPVSALALSGNGRWLGYAREDGSGGFAPLP